MIQKTGLRVRALCLLFAALLLPAVTSAQFDTATVVGTIKDASGGVVPGVTVSLRNVSTGIAAETITDTDGNYQFGNVRIGPYIVRASLQGFSTAEAKDVVVTVGARQRVDLVLQTGNITETVEVTGASKLLETDSSDRGQVITKEQIVNLPLNGRNYADLALLTPGVRKSAISDSRDASFNVHGLRSALNSFVLDGVDNNSYGTSNQGFSNQVVQVHRCARGVQGPDQQLQRRVWPDGWCGHQRLLPQRHQPVHRLGLGGPSQ